MMPRRGGGRVGCYWNATMEAWFKDNPQMFLSFPYVGMDFRGDREMGLPTGYAWEKVGMFLCFILHLLEYYILYVYYDDSDIVLLLLQMLVSSDVQWLGWWDTIRFGILDVLLMQSGDREELQYSLTVEHLAGRLVLQGRESAQLLLRVLLRGLTPRQGRLM